MIFLLRIINKVEDEYSPSKIKEALINIITNLQNISPTDIKLIENSGRGNCLYNEYKLNNYFRQRYKV